MVCRGHTLSPPCSTHLTAVPSSSTLLIHMPSTLEERTEMVSFPTDVPEPRST